MTFSIQTGNIPGIVVLARNSITRLREKDPRRLLTTLMYQKRKKLSREGCVVATLPLILYCEDRNL
jgi:hypothetical protein